MVIDIEDRETQLRELEDIENIEDADLEEEALPEEPDRVEIQLGLEDKEGDETVTGYLKEIGARPLLTFAEEQHLGMVMENGRILSRLEAEGIAQHGSRPSASELVLRLLTIAGKEATNEQEFLDVSVARQVLPQQVWDLLRAWGWKLSHLPQEAEIREALEPYSAEFEEHLSYLREQADKAERLFVESNLRLVVNVARKYVSRGVPLMDLVQEGNLGLMRAVQKFDYHRGHKFSTYATWWIRQSIVRALARQARNIRLPVHMIEAINRYVQTQARLCQEYGHEVTTRDVAKAMGISVAKVEEIRRAAAQVPVSLSQPVGEEETGELSELVPDEHATSPEDEVARKFTREEVDRVLASLSPRERKVLELRFGLEDGNARTLEEVGREFRLTRERIRQIEIEALRKLRRPEMVKTLAR